MQKTIKYVLWVMIFLVTGLLPVKLPAASVNDGFDPNADGTVRAIATQADGRILVGGDFTSIGGQTRNYIARLNIDGTADTTFDPNANGSVYALLVQADGKIVAGGGFSTIGGQTRNGIARLNADGSLDTTFDPGAGATDNGVLALAVQADGKIIAGGSFTTIAGVSRNRLARFNADGSLDTTFNPNANGVIWCIAVQQNGKIVAGGSFSMIGIQTRNNIARINANGTVDTTYNPNANGVVMQLGVQPDGKIIAAGYFSTIGGLTRIYTARLNDNGTADTTFSANLDTVVTALAIQADGRIIISAGDLFSSSIYRLNSDGSDNATLSSNVVGAVYDLTVQADGNVLAGGEFSTISGQTRNRIARLYADGTVDMTLNPNANNLIRTIYRQADGKILLGGDFTSIGGQIRNFIARLNADGSLDAGFDPNFNGHVYALSVQEDGKILVAGYFTRIGGLGLGGVTRNNLSRLNANGSVDSTFNPNVNGPIYSMLVQADGSILLGGNFTNIGGQLINRIARLNLNGSVDTSFNPNANGPVNVLTLQADGKILVMGDFTSIGGQTRNNIARLNADGSFDATFNPTIPGGIVSAVMQPDGKILVCGFGWPSAGQLNADGSLDTTFPIISQSSFLNRINSLAVQADGNILVGGWFTQIGGQARNNIARLNADGSLDATFDPNVNGYVILTAVQADGKILTAGNFSTIGGLPRNYFARISADEAALQDLHVSGDGTAITWSRGQSSPELYDVYFESSSDMTTWTLLGPGTPIAGGWQLTGQALPFFANHYVRASGKTSGGLYRDPTSILSSVRQFYNAEYVTITKAGNGTGTVTATGCALEWFGATGMCKAPSGTPVVFTAIPDNSSNFTGWTNRVGPTVVCTGTGPCSFTNDSNSGMTANFDLKTYTVTPSAGVNGIISPNTPQTITHGSTTNFTVTPTTGYHAVMGGACGGALVGDTYTTNAITGDCTVSASFELNTYIVTTMANNGTITSALNPTVSHGSATTVTGSAYSGYYFSGVSGCGGTAQSNSDQSVTAFSYTTGAVTSDCTVTATFNIKTYTVTPSADANGSISPNTPQTINHGSTTNFTVTPTTGYHAVMSGACGGILSGSTYTTNAITADCTVIASFEVNTYTVTTTANNGAITSTINPTVSHGSATTVTGLANANHHFAGVSGCGGTAQSNSNQSVTAFSYTTGNVTGACTITATFNIKTYTVTTTANNGAITSTINPTVSHGSTTTVTGSANANHYFAGVSGCGGTAQSNSDQSVTAFSYTTGNVTGACTVTATFKSSIGDLNTDGSVDATDALKVLRIVAGLVVPSADEISRGDAAPIVNSKPQPDGKINIGDVVVILRKAVGLVSW